MQRTLNIVAVSVLTIAVSWFVSANQPTTAQNAKVPHRVAWEYRSTTWHHGNVDMGSATHLGKDGWELVAIYSPNNRDGKCYALFKRQR